MSDRLPVTLSQAGQHLGDVIYWMLSEACAEATEKPEGLRVPSM